MRMFIVVILIGLSISAVIDYFAYNGRHIEQVARELGFNIHISKR